MKSSQFPQEEITTSIAQRLLNRRKFTQDYFLKEKNKTAEDRRLNEFYKQEEELRKKVKNG